MSNAEGKGCSNSSLPQNLSLQSAECLYMQYLVTITFNRDWDN